MTASPSARPPRRRWGAAALIVVLAALIIVVVVVGVVTAATGSRRAGEKEPASGPTSSAPASGAATTAPSASPRATASAAPRTSKPAAASTPQPTKSVDLTAPATIIKSLQVKVVKLEAVTGTAQGPGEIGGPSVRFTIRIANDTGKSVDLSNTVVNAYYGTDMTPAVQLEQPGGHPFPATVKTGSTTEGVFLFNIAKSARAHVEVTVDTSVSNPVVAFKGSAP